MGIAIPTAGEGLREAACHFGAHHVVLAHVADLAIIVIGRVAKLAVHDHAELA